MDSFIPIPPSGFATTTRYSLRARPKRMFHTILDAHRLLDGESHSTLRFEERGSGVELEMIHHIATGRIEERLTLQRNDAVLVSDRLHRQLFDEHGERVRNEEAHFFREGLGFAQNTYPEVLLPMMLGWLGPARRTRAFYSWINDRFVSRMYAQTGGSETLRLAGRNVETFQVVMYPDINDYVRVGATLAKMAKAIMPKYHLWFDSRIPHRVVRFEGSYGPPGAPEVIMELAAP